MLQSSYTSKASGRSHPLTVVDTDQETREMVVTWPRVSAIQIVRDHLLRRLVYPHTIDSAAVQLCPDGDPKVIRLLSESFLAGVKGDPTRSALQILYRPTTVHLRRAVPPTELGRLNVLKEMQLPWRLSDCYSMAIRRTDG